MLSLLLVFSLVPGVVQPVDSTQQIGQITESKELNTLGYELLYGMRKADDAIRVSELNTKAFPTSSNAFDNLGGVEGKGKQKTVIACYKKALELDPGNQNAATRLRET